MVLRNRLIALLIRIALLVLYSFPVAAYMGEYSNPAVALATFSLQLMVILITMTGFEIVFNIIDLVRHGVHGVPAGPYMPIALPLNVFAIISGILYFSALLPSGAAPAGTYAIIFHVMVILGPLVDWVFLCEKGTVRFSNAFIAQLYPILYYIFGYFRTIIWDDTPIYNGNMYAYPFLDYLGPNIVLNTVLFFALTLGASALAVFLNNVLAGRYGFILKTED